MPIQTRPITYEDMLYASEDFKKLLKSFNDFHGTDFNDLREIYSMYDTTLADLEDLQDPEKISKNVEDSITNQLDNFNEASGERFCDIEELYTAYMNSLKTIKDQDLHIIQLEMKIEELKKNCKTGYD